VAANQNYFVVHYHFILRITRRSPERGFSARPVQGEVMPDLHQILSITIRRSIWAISSI
jgi:hypothetical protein